MTPADSPTVWKAVIPQPTDTGRAWVDLPQDAELLSVGVQGFDLVVWAKVDPGHPVGGRRLIVVNTGQEISGFPVDAKFLGTVTTPGGVVWHVWDGDA